MNYEKMTEPRAYRLLKAVAITFALVVAVPGVDAVVRYVAGPQTAIAANVEGKTIDAASMIKIGDPFASLDRMEDIAGAMDDEVPEAFSREVGLPADARDVRVGGAGNVVGYTVDGECGQVMAQIEESMRARGWTRVPLGGMEGSTFVKQSGSCTWTLITCTQQTGSVAVVARCVIE